MNFAAFRPFFLPALLAVVSFQNLPAQAQDTKGLGTIIEPLEPEREVGLPDQAAPQPTAPVIAPNTPRPAPRAQAAPAPAAQAPAAATPKVTETAFSDWKMECISGAAALPCQIVHRALSGDQKQVLMVLSIAYAAKEKENRFQMALPLGFDVQSGVTLDFGNEHSTKVEVNRCTAQGCLVDGKFTPEIVAAMTEAKTGKASIKTVEGKPIDLPFSLSGFGAAFAEMKKKNDPSS